MVDPDSTEYALQQIVNKCIPSYEPGPGEYFLDVQCLLIEISALRTELSVLKHTINGMDAVFELVGASPEEIIERASISPANVINLFR